MKETDLGWHIRLFKKSILKQEKFRAISKFLDTLDNKKCLDIGGDSGILSYYLRALGGDWTSADLGEKTVRSINELVGKNVYEIDGGKTPFPSNTFDIVVIIDFLEHIQEDKIFIQEMYRVMDDRGIIIINVPHIKKISFLYPIKKSLGLTDERHGHIRPGYTIMTLRNILCDRFRILEYRTYSKFFTQFIDAIIQFVSSTVKGGGYWRKGIWLGSEDVKNMEKGFKFYSFLYPFTWLISRLDYLIFFTKGYNLIIKAQKIV